MALHLRGEVPDLAALNTSLPALLSAYVQVLDRASREPLLSIHHWPRSPIKSPSSSGLQALLRNALAHLALPLLFLLRPIRAWWWGFAIRPLVKLFIETHISAKTTHIGRRLRLTRLKFAEESSEDIHHLDYQLRLLEYGQQITVGWSRLLPVLRFAPLVGTLFSLGFFAFQFDIHEAPRQMYTILASLPAVMLLVYPLVVRFGFRWKRVIFLTWPLEPSQGVNRLLPLDGNPAPNIYELENKLYFDMRTRKKREAPVDVFLHPAPYILSNTIVSTIASVASG